MSASVSTSKAIEPRLSIPSILLFLVAALIMRSLIATKLVDMGFALEVAKHMSALAGFVVLGLLLCPLLLKVRPSIRQHFGRVSSAPELILTSAALGFVLWLWQMTVLVALTPLSWPNTFKAAVPTAPSYSLACTNAELLLLAIPVMTVITPVIEELVYRGMILRALLHKGKTQAILQSAVLFAVLHEPATIPYAFFCGVFLALQMIQCGNLWAPIITHAVANLLVTLSAACLVGRWQPGVVSSTAVSTTALIVITLLACPLAAWFLATKIKAGAAPAGSAPA